MADTDITNDSPGIKGDWRYLDHADMSAAIAAFCFGNSTRESIERVSDALSRWVDDGLAVTVRQGKQYFSYSEVIQHMISASLSGKDRFYFDSRVRLLRVAAEHLRGSTASGVNMSLTRTFFLRDLKQTKLRLKIPAPLEAASRVCDVTCAPTFPGVTQRIASGRIEITTPAFDNTEEVAVTATFKISNGIKHKLPDLTSVLSYDANDQQLQPFLADVIAAINIDDSWRAFSQSIAQVKHGTFAAVKAFWHWLAQNGRFSVIDQSQWQPKTWIAEKGKPFLFDCFTGSSFLIALCRAQGIPARLVSGYSLSLPCPGPHYWFEVLADQGRWLPIDLAGWELAHGDVKDGHWLDWYFGSSEGRMATEIFPHLFIGPIGIPMPNVWSYYPSFGSLGFTTTICDAYGRKIFSDTLKMGGDL